MTTLRPIKPARGELLEGALDIILDGLAERLQGRAKEREPLFWTVRETAEHIGASFGENRVRELVRSGVFAHTRKDPGNLDSQIMIDPDSVRAWKHGLIFPE